MKTDFILLAAGQSSRMGRDKALLSDGSQLWIQTQAQAILGSGVIQRLFIVGQPQALDHYEKVLEFLDEESVVFIGNPKTQSEPFDSLAIALELFPFSEGAFVSPIDVPLESGILRRLWLHHQNHLLCLKPSFQGRGGHPVWLHSSALAEFRKVPKRLDHFLSEIPPERRGVCEISFQKVVLNLNTPEEWERYSHNKNENEDRL